MIYVIGMYMLSHFLKPFLSTKGRLYHNVSVITYVLTICKTMCSWVGLSESHRTVYGKASIVVVQERINYVTTMSS